MNRKTLFALLSALVLVVALVGPVAAQDDPGTIVDIAASNEDFSTLVAAVQAAGLADTLSSEGPFTVFAPTNAAFEALPDGTIDALLADPAGDLTQILLYHVVPSRAMAADLSDGMVLTTVQGGELTVGISGDSVTVNGVNVVATDIEASNGVIHVIDAVLIPPAADEVEAGDMAEDASAEGDMAEGDMAEGESAEGDMAEGDMAEGESMAGDDMSKGGVSETPSTMPTTGGNFGSSSLFIVVAGAVVAGLAGSTWYSRRRR